MTQSIAIDSTAALSAAADSMDDIAGALTRALSTLHHTLVAQGDPLTVRENLDDAPTVGAGTSDAPPWGADSYGKTFAAGTDGYVGMSVGLLQGAFDLAHTLSEFAYGMHRAAGDLRTSEDDTSTTFG